MARNNNLHQAKSQKNDSFFTLYESIEKEMQYYQEFFAADELTVLCNCDNPFESNFVKYLLKNFHILNLKRIIAISYAGSEMLEETRRFFSAYLPNFDICNRGIVVDIREYDFNLGCETPEAILNQIHSSDNNVLTSLRGDGDFRSEESIQYLKECDLVFTNEPFSLAKEFLSLILKYQKRFLVLFPLNIITYKSVFPFIERNNIWLGVTKPHSFLIPYPTMKNNVFQNSYGQWIATLGNVIWLTNIPHNRRNDFLPLTTSYYKSPYAFPVYDNCNAIEVSRVKDIPYDYEGVMGVPITFLQHYNPVQFKVLGLSSNDYVEKLHIHPIGQEWIDAYKSQGGRGHLTANMHNLVLTYPETGNKKEVYKRIFIKKRQ